MNRPSIYKLAVSSFLLCIIVGCSYARNPATPIPVTTFSNNNSGEDLILLLPGLGDMPEDFQDNGFVQALKNCNPGLQVIAADAHLGYYNAETISLRLYQDIIFPAKQRGVKRIWLAGISLGGLGSLITIIDYPGEINGAILLSPYLGKNNELSELIAEENIFDWESSNDNNSTLLWSRLIEREKEKQLPTLYLGTGKSDRFITLQMKLGQIINENNIYTIPGKHNWNTWEVLWAEILASHPLCTTKNSDKS